MVKFERLQMLANSIDALQRADYLTYEQFSIAFNLEVKTVTHWANDGRLPVIALSPGVRGKPAINMKQYRLYLEKQMVCEKFQEAIEQIKAEQEARDLAQKAVIGSR